MDKLRPMDEHKRRYHLDFLQRTEANVIDYISIIKANEKRLHNSFVEDIKLSSNEFVKMILVNVAFIIEAQENKTRNSDDTKRDGTARGRSKVQEGIEEVLI
ncbi:hypothetical protein JRO89_XS10G0040000 [Xanthoceras sorbifolium]|uniref:Uncharacterized protein n=1 Tax=Xanthoceras sorbifolium TaxID=99658 RepID=A0ABQ8HHI3_9ROSI|nr:hypothetical protein JRO89_XS10G0040000 [Xanthoceras sorbifolium]